MDIINNIVRQFRSTFIIDNRYKVFLTGFKNTMLITIVAALIGIAVGTVLAVLHNIASQKQRHNNLGGTLIRLLDKLLTAYVAVMRGTPLAIQLMIWAFVLLAGISGTGKTRLVRLFAEALGAKKTTFAASSFLVFVSTNLALAEPAGIL